jgi:hypothetical protein
MDILTLAFIIILIGILWAALRLNSQIRAYPKHTTQHLMIPILSVDGSDQNRVTFEICDHLGALRTAHVITRLLSHHEEEAIRQRRLIPHEKAPPLEQGVSLQRLHTQSFISLIDDLEGMLTSLSLSGFIQAQFSNIKPLSTPVTLEFKAGDQAIYSSDFSAEVMASSILVEASALVLTCHYSGDHTQLKALQHKIHRIIEWFTTQKEHQRPLWIMVTHEDDLDDDSLTKLKTSLCPQLHLDNSLDVVWSMITYEDDKSPSFKEAGLIFFKRLSPILQRSHDALLTRRLLQHKRKIRWGQFSVLLILLIWFISGSFMLSQLPKVHLVDEWSTSSLSMAEDQLTSSLIDAQNIFSPLFMRRSDIAERLEYLHHRHLQHLVELLDESVTQLNDESFEDFTTLGLTLINTKKHVQALIRMLRKSIFYSVHRPDFIKLESSLSGLIILNQLSQSLISHLDGVELASKIRQSDQQMRVITARWERACLNSVALNCELIRLKETLFKRALERSLTLVPSHNHSGLMGWYRYTCFHTSDPKTYTFFERKLFNFWRHFQKTLEITHRTSHSSIKRVRALKQLYEEKEENLSHCPQMSWPKSIESLWVESLNTEIYSLSTYLNLTSAVPLTYRAEANHMIRWAEHKLAPSQRIKILFQLTSTHWLTDLKRTIHELSDDKIQETIKQIHLAIARMETQEAHTQISSHLNQWRIKLDELLSWLKPHTVQFNASTLNCDEEALDKSGESKWRLLIGDYLHYYFTLSINNQVILSVEADTKGQLIWSPWDSVRLQIYEKDGDIDHKSDESNDTQIGNSKKVVWGAIPEGNISLSLNQTGSCQVHIRFIDTQFPSWLR